MIVRAWPSSSTIKIIPMRVLPISIYRPCWSQGSRLHAEHGCLQDLHDWHSPAPPPRIPAKCPVTASRCGCLSQESSPLMHFRKPRPVFVGGEMFPISGITYRLVANPSPGIDSAVSADPYPRHCPSALGLGCCPPGPYSRSRIREPGAPLGPRRLRNCPAWEYHGP